MKKKKMFDPYAQLLDRFNQEGVKYVVVGMSGINYYASRAQETFATQDFDIFIKPTIINVKKAIEVFRALNYSLAVKEGELKDSLVKNAVAQKILFQLRIPMGSCLS